MAFIVSVKQLNKQLKKIRDKGKNMKKISPLFLELC